MSALSAAHAAQRRWSGRIPRGAQTRSEGSGRQGVAVLAGASPGERRGHTAGVAAALPPLFPG